MTDAGRFTIRLDNLCAEICQSTLKPSLSGRGMRCKCQRDPIFKMANHPVYADTDGNEHATDEEKQ